MTSRDSCRLVVVVWRCDVTPSPNLAEVTNNCHLQLPSDQSVPPVSFVVVVVVVVAAVVVMVVGVFVLDVTSLRIENSRETKP